MKTEQVIKWAPLKQRAFIYFLGPTRIKCNCTFTVNIEGKEDKTIATPHPNKKYDTPVPKSFHWLSPQVPRRCTWTLMTTVWSQWSTSVLKWVRAVSLFGLRITSPSQTPPDWPSSKRRAGRHQFPLFKGVPQGSVLDPSIFDTGPGVSRGGNEG